ncbi:MAG: hypothetical protein QF681_16750 [Vicinamibacterales bacterium]|jgi:uncharacterized membrane protein|nr:hypothetical protein [Vicinamibacterales bacterium]
MNSPSTRMWVGLFVLVVFVAGLGAGVAVRPLIWMRAGPPAGFGRPGLAGRPGGPAPARMTERLLDRIAADIELTTEQDQQLREVFETRRQRLREINDEVRVRFETEQEQMNSDIAAILTPDQMEIFENEIVRMRQDRRGRGGRPGRLRRGPGLPQ